MADTVDVGGGDGGDIGADAGEGTSEAPDLQSIADQVDSEGVVGAEGTTEDGQGDGEGGVPAPSDPLDHFIAQNYQGNRDAFLQSQFESRAEAKRQAERIRELESRHAPPPPARDIDAEVKTRFESDPDVQAVNSEMQDLESRNQKILSGQAAIGEEAGKLQGEIAGLNGQLLHVDDLDKPKLLHQLTLKQNRLEALQIRFDAGNDKLDSIAARYKDKHRELVRLERQIRDSVSSEERAQSSILRLKTSTRANFVTSYDEVARTYGLEQGSEGYQYFREVARTQLRDFLESQGDDAEALDASGIHEAVTKLMAAAARNAGLRRRVPGASTAKPPRVTPRPVITPRRPLVSPNEAARPGHSPAPRVDQDVFSSPELIRRRADAILQRAARRR